MYILTSSGIHLERIQTAGLPGALQRRPGTSGLGQGRRMPYACYPSHVPRRPVAPGMLRRRSIRDRLGHR